AAWEKVGQLRAGVGRRVRPWGPFPVVATTRNGRTSAGALTKRVLDVLAAGALLALFTPVFVVVVVVITVDSRGPVLHRFLRGGHCGSQFAMLKFRKMRQ